MNTQLLDAIRIIIKEELKEQDKRIDVKFKEQDARIHAKFDEQDIKIGAKFRAQDYKIDIKFKSQDDKLDAMLEAWQIQKEHRKKLNDHEDRIKAIEHRIPVIS